MKLNELVYTPGSRRHKQKIVGRGHGSGMGKTSTRGGKGQKARKSGKTRPGFEGGQTPLFRRLPKIGFNNYEFANEYSVVNVKDLAHIVELNLTKSKMHELGLIKTLKLPVKLIGNASVKLAFQVEADKISAGALKALQDAKGAVVTLKK